MAADFLERMGNRMRERRDELGLSRAEVARRMPGKVNENQIYRWEKGLHQPNSDTLQALADVLDCDVSHFMAPTPAKDTTPEPFPSDSVEMRLERIEEQLKFIRVVLTELARSELDQAGLQEARVTPRRRDARRGSRQAR